MPSVATDAELVRRYLAGDQRALGDIYERYGDRVYDMCFAMLRSADDAADAYQDTFLTAADKLGQLRDTERLRSWLYSVARNQCRARLRAACLPRCRAHRERKATQPAFRSGPRPRPFG